MLIDKYLYYEVENINLIRTIVEVFGKTSEEIRLNFTKCKNNKLTADIHCTNITRTFFLKGQFNQELIQKYYCDTNNFEFIITQSGPEKLHTLINKEYGKPLKVICGEFEKGRPFHIIVLSNKLCLINVHFGHNKNLKSELKIIKNSFEDNYDKDLIKKMEEYYDHSIVYPPKEHIFRSSEVVEKEKHETFTNYSKKYTKKN
jgi:hypothetical protein